jgi:hypothetical protein
MLSHGSVAAAQQTNNKLPVFQEQFPTRRNL